MKLKLLLSMIWVAAAEPYDVTRPARVWAELLGLPAPETGGAARVNAAIRRLVEGQYLAAERRPGMPSRLFLLEETGTGLPYTHPGSHWEKGNKNARKGDNRARYLQVPVELWTNGWIAVLSGPAIAMYLALLEQSRGTKFEGIWFSPAVADRRYALTEITRKKGLTQLREAGLIDLDRKAVGRGTLDTIRFRNTYSIDQNALKQKAGEMIMKGARMSRRAGFLTVDDAFASMNAHPEEGDDE